MAAAGNGHVERFDSRPRDELLNRGLFVGLADARWVVDRWRLDYNHHRPRSPLGYAAPSKFSAESTGLPSIYVQAAVEAAIA